jgi:hypothetical protein
MAIFKSDWCQDCDTKCDEDWMCDCCVALLAHRERSDDE